VGYWTNSVFVGERMKWKSWMTWGWVNYQQKFFLKSTTPLIWFWEKSKLQYENIRYVSDWVCAVSSKWITLGSGKARQHHVHHHVLLLALRCGSIDCRHLLLWSFLVSGHSLVIIDEPKQFLCLYFTYIERMIFLGLQNGVMEGR